MDPRRLSAGDWIAAAGGILLLVALFLPWYRVAGERVTAWESMSVDDVLLALVSLGTLAAVAATAMRSREAVPVHFTGLAELGGLLAVVIVAWRVLDPAPAASAGLAVGAWLGLAGALAVAGGAWAGMRDEGPARRSAEAARAAARAGFERAEPLSLPPDVGHGA